MRTKQTRDFSKNYTITGTFPSKETIAKNLLEALSGGDVDGYIAECVRECAVSDGSDT